MMVLVATGVVIARVQACYRAARQEGDVTVRVLSPAATSSTLFHRPAHPTSATGDSSNFVPGSLLTFNDTLTIDPETTGSTLTTGQAIYQR